jgi:hypothetical protein
MRHSELSKQVDKEKIEELLHAYFTVHHPYLINYNGVVDVDGNVQLIKEAGQLPVTFGTVSGDFACYNNHLTSLQGAPTSVGGSFNCSRNHLTSLQNAPISVKGDFVCFDDKNSLTSLQGIGPNSDLKSFYCTWSEYLPILRSLVVKHSIEFHYPERGSLCREIGGILNTAKANNPNNLRGAILDAQKALIEAGFAGNARW